MGKYHRFFAVFTVVLFAFYSEIQSADVSYDGRAIKIDGERRLIISGSIHYPRSTDEMWPSLIQKAKDGGLNSIETYVFWNVHEPVRRQYDFTGNLDLVKFIKTIQNAGLYAILRIGPYVCAEWNYGGFPVWLHNMDKNIIFRTTNQIFMDEMKTFTTKIVNMMKEEKLFASDGGPIILAQIENEFGNVEGHFQNGVDVHGYVNQCVSFAEGLKTGVPWIMCQQGDAPDPIINTCNGFYCDQFWPRNNNLPKIWTENWSGWFKNWGDADPHRTAEDLAFAAGRFYQLRGTVMNYYMYHGGTNFGRTAAARITTSYDYDAPIDEYGLVNQPKWGHLKQLHEILLSMEKILTYGDFTDNDYGRMMFSTVFSLNGTRVCFFGNANTQDDITITFEGQQITTPAWSVSIYRDCKTEIFNTARVNVQRDVLEKVKNQGDLKWTWRAEPIEHVKDHPVKHPPTFAPQLLDQKSVTNDTSDYLWYMTSVNLDKNDPLWGRELTLEVHTSGHGLHVFFNNKHIGARWVRDGQFSFDLEDIGDIKHGTNTISLLSGSFGLPNYDAYFDTVSLGVLGPVKLIAPSGEEMDLTNTTWGYKVGINGIDEKQLYTDKERRSWRPDIQVNRPLVWYKTSFDTPPGDDPVVLDLEDMGKGFAWVNGNNIGRYWPSFFSNAWGCDPSCNYRGDYGYSDKCRTNCGKPTQKWYHVPRSFLNKDGKKNNLVLFEEFGGNPAKVSVETVTLTKVCANAYEGHTLNITCQGRVISHVNFASFGDPTGTCGAFTKGNCDSSKSMSVVQKECVGKKNCLLDVSEKTFGPISGCSAPTKRHAVEVLCR